MSDPVTVIVRRRVKPGQEAAYEDWLHRLNTDVAGMAGFLGSQIQKPASAKAPYVSVFRFDTLEHLEAFEASDVRRLFELCAERCPPEENDND